MEDNKKIIVDDKGNPLNNRWFYNLKGYIKDNIWNILGKGIATLATLQGIVMAFSQMAYARDCASFYGIHNRYFDGSDVFRSKIMYLVACIFLIIYIWALGYIGKKMKSKIDRAFIFIATMLFLFVQNVIYTCNIISRGGYAVFENEGFLIVSVVVYIISDIIIAFYMVLRKHCKKWKEPKKVEGIILGAALCVYAFCAVGGIMAYMGTEIEDKRTYEIISDSDVIVSTYEGMFVTMKCRVEEDTLYIDKGKCKLRGMENEEISYYEFEEVICK